MSEFKIGDVVVCIRDKPLHNMTLAAKPYWAALKLNKMYRVTGLIVDASGRNGVNLADVSSGPFPGWCNTLFRKLPAADAEFTAMLKASKTQKVSA